MKKKIRVLFELTKIRISLLATFTAAVGFVLSRKGISLEILIPVAGIFLLACGACSLNQYQERERDRLMERTRLRPLPTGQVSPGQALLISILLIVSGSLFLFLEGNRLVAAVGLYGVFWYNGVYTYLKRRITFAAVPGALVGTVPPVVGWVSGGGSLSDPQCWSLALFCFLWQVPHFWLILLKDAENYQKAGFPILTTRLSQRQLKRVIFSWMLSAVVSVLLIPLLGGPVALWPNFLLWAGAIWLIWKAIHLIRDPIHDGFSYRLLFLRLNVYVFWSVSAIAANRLLAG